VSPATLQLEFLLRARIELAPVQELGDAPLGRRRIIAITGGSFAGPSLPGTVLPAAPTTLIRPDGVPGSGALHAADLRRGAIYVQNSHRHGPAPVIARLAASEDVDPALYYFRTAPGSRPRRPSTTGSTAASAQRRAARLRRARRAPRQLKPGTSTIHDPKHHVAHRPRFDQRPRPAGVYRDEGIPRSRNGSRRPSPPRPQDEPADPDERPLIKATLSSRPGRLPAGADHQRHRPGAARATLAVADRRCPASASRCARSA
jgi:hypothetical protein